MNQLEVDLKNLVSDELVEVAWDADYPLNQGVGLWSFFNGLKKGGFFIDVNHGEKRAEFFLRREVLGKLYEFHSQMTFDQISRGWGMRPKGSAKCLYDSICVVHDLMERGKFPRDDRSRDNLDKRSDWANFRTSNSRRIRKLMEDEMKIYFIKYQEHLFIPVSGSIPQLSEPRLVYRVMESFPLFAFDIADTMRDARFIVEESDGSKFGRGVVLTPCAETILEYGFDWESYNPSYYPSESTLIDLFLGRYLHRFSQIKGYNTWFNNNLREFVVSHSKAFRYGEYLDFPKELKNKEGIFY
jgi:hypothetical protein